MRCRESGVTAVAAKAAAQSLASHLAGALLLDDVVALALSALRWSMNGGARHRRYRRMCWICPRSESNRPLKCLKLGQFVKPRRTTAPSYTPTALGGTLRDSSRSLSSVVPVAGPRGDYGTLKPPNGLLNPEP